MSHGHSGSTTAALSPPLAGVTMPNFLFPTRDYIHRAHQEALVAMLVKPGPHRDPVLPVCEEQHPHPHPITIKRKHRPLIAHSLF